MKAVILFFLYLVFVSPETQKGINVHIKVNIPRKHRLVIDFITHQGKTVKILGPNENRFDTVLNTHTPYTLYAHSEGFFSENYVLYSETCLDTNLVIQLKPSVFIISE